MNLVLRLLIVGLITVTCNHARGQVQYSINEANVDKYRGFAYFDVSGHLLGTTGMGFSGGAMSQYRLPALPITLSGRFKYEAVGLGKVLYKGEAYGKSRMIDLTAMMPLIPARKKEGKVKVTTKYEAYTTSTYEEYFYAQGQVKNQLLARAGIFQYWTSGNFTSSGLSAGLALRMLKHVDVTLSDEKGYYREVNINRQIYADILYAPIVKGIGEGETLDIGGRIGYLSVASDAMCWYTELELRPGSIGTLTFGWIFGWDLK